jgi:hypothetical protein
MDVTVVEAEKKMTGSIFIYNSRIQDITKRSTCRGGRGRRSETRFRKIEGEIFPGFPLRAMSHADVIYGALNEMIRPPRSLGTSNANSHRIAPR